jgi:16S rRNA (guanine966-N2)-methyltransferase
MRIIAGTFRGRTLLAPVSDATRPITDRVKQSLFDIIALAIPGAIVYDGFAGTGSMGLESLSRGADRAVFFERDQTALARLRQNINALGVVRQSRVVSADIFKWFAAPGSRPTDADRAGIVFLDPPYRFLSSQADDLRDLASRIARDHLAQNGIVVFRHDSRDRLELPGLVRYDQRTYGSMALEFLHRQR